MKQLVLIALLFSSTIYAQNRDRIKAVKAAHITEALDLTVSEAQQFWPVYNAFEEKLHKLRFKERKEIFEVLKNDMEGISNEEADILIEKGFLLKSKELEYGKELVENLRGIIPSKKIIKLKRAEEEFKRMLLKRMQNRRNKRGN